MQIQLYSADWQPISAALPATVREASAIRPNEVAHFALGIPRTALDATNLQIASNLLVMGRLPARITKRDTTGDEIRLEALGCDDLLNGMLTPYKWTRYNDTTLYPDVSDVVTDLLCRFRMKRWTTLADWTAAYATSQVEALNLPDIGDSVILDTEPYYDAQRYLASGYIVLRYQLPETALSSGRVVRWTEHVGAENRIKVQTRSADSEAALDAAAWSGEIELTHAEGIEDNETVGADVADGGRWVDLRFNLYTEDRETVDNEEETTIVGTTPVLAGVELIWREAGPVAVGEISPVGKSLSDTEYTRMQHLKALKEICDREGWTYRIRLYDGQLVLDFARSFGFDFTEDALLSHQGNCIVEAMSENDDELATVMHCWGAGSGAEQLYVELRDEPAVALYGERHADFKDEAIADLATLTAKGQEELDKRKEPRRDYVVRTYLERIGNAWVQDTISISDQAAGVIRTAEIKELNISENATEGEVVRLGLGAKIVTIIDDIAGHLPHPGGYSPQPPLAAPMLRATGQYQAIALKWGMVAGASTYDIEVSENAGATWRLLQSGVAALRYVHPGLPLDTSRTYRVYAKREGIRSAASNVAAATAKEKGAPLPPTGVTAVAVLGKTVRVKWTPPVGVIIAEYRIYRKPGDTPGDPTDAVQIAEETGDSHLDVTGEYGQTYTYFIKAVDRSENVSESFSNGAAATVAKIDIGDVSGATTSYFQATPPVNPVAGDLWFDTANGNVVKRWSGTEWQDASDLGIAAAIEAAADAQATADGRIKTFVQATEPTAEAIGDLWIHTGQGNVLYRWNGSEWINVQDAGIAVALQAAEEALDAAADAQETADGRIVTYYQASAPATGKLGDLWFDTAHGNKLYRHDGTSWVEAQDAGIGEAIDAAAGAQATADGKVTTFYAASAPAAEGVGDLWVDTAHGNKLHRWSGVSWVSAQDLTPDIANPVSLGGTGWSFGDDALYQDAEGHWWVRVTINLTDIPADSKRASVQIKHRKTGGTTFSMDDQIDVVSGSASATVDDLLPNVAYEFAAVPVSHYGIEGGAKTGSKTTAKDNQAPATPSNVGATGIICGIAVQWDQPAEPDYDRTIVRIGTADGFDPDTEYTKEVIVNGKSAEITEGLTSGTTYYARMKHVDTSGNASDWSAQVSAMAGYTDAEVEVLQPVPFSANYLKNGRCFGSVLTHDGWNFDSKPSGFTVTFGSAAAPWAWTGALVEISGGAADGWFEMSQDIPFNLFDMPSTAAYRWFHPTPGNPDGSIRQKGLTLSGMVTHVNTSWNLLSGGGGIPDRPYGFIGYQGLLLGLLLHYLDASNAMVYQTALTVWAAGAFAYQEYEGGPYIQQLIAPAMAKAVAPPPAHYPTAVKARAVVRVATDYVGSLRFSLLQLESGSNITYWRENPVTNIP